MRLALNAFGYFVAYIAAIARDMESPTVRWSQEAVGLLAAEFTAIALLLSLTFVLQARKKDFL